MEKTITLQDLYRELKRIEANMITKEQLNSIIETIEILGNEDTMDQIRESELNIKKGDIKEIESTEDL